MPRYYFCNRRSKFIMEIMTVFWQMLTLFMFIVIGMVCSRRGIVNESNAQCISKLIVMIFNPASFQAF